ncbi:MAG: rRNA adenine N-6-methyltransferase family protein [Myxococcales bacterium]|nr:rRNA adenine N-6-methyltransferase family protein [Myxococcales bacterium]
MVRLQLSQQQLSPAEFRAALMRVPFTARDTWLDLVFELDGIPDDGPELPRGCVPYLPCPVDVLCRLVEHARIEPSDVVVDVGAGPGRAAAVLHLMTGAAVVALEIQPALVDATRALAARLHVDRLAVIEGDAAELTGRMHLGSVFFLYCPFSGERLERVLTDLEAIARTREIRVCCVDLPLPPVPWLELASPAANDLAVYRSVTPRASPGTAQSLR